MPPSRKGSTSGFAAAAKVLFDSAQRVGAVQPLEQSTKEYAHQLKKIQSQSKKRGGSLGSVSYKVAEFLAAQRAPEPYPPRRAHVPLERSIAKKVPLIDIPPIPPNAAATAMRPLLHSETKAVKVEAHARPTTPLASLFTAMAAPEAAATPSVLSSPPPEVEATKSAAEIAPPVEEVLVVEDRPVFEVRQPAAALPAPAAIIQPIIVAKPIETHMPVKRTKPVVSVPIAFDVHSVGGSASAEDQASSPLTTSPPSFSVDAWEKQREKELERLQRKQYEEEQLRLAVVREKEHQTLGKEWVEQRTVTGAFEADLTPGGRLLREVYYASSVDAALSSFQKMIDAGAKAAALLPAGISSVAYHIREGNPAEQTRYKRLFLEMVEKAKLADILKRKAQLAVSSGSEFLAAYDALTSLERLRLDTTIVIKAVRLLLLGGRWEEALALARASRGSFRSGSEAVDLTLLRICRGLEEGPRKEVVAYATQSLTEQGRLGKTAKLLIARTETGVYRRTLLKQIAASSDVDEVVYAELIVRSGKDQTEGILAEVAARGLNPEDPVVLGAVAMKKLEDENPAEVFKEIGRQVDKIGIRPVHVLVATKVAALHPTEEMLRQAKAVVLSTPAVTRGVGLRRLLPLLYQHGQVDDIVEIADKTNEMVPLVDLLPKAVAFVNEALLRVGRPPLSEARVSDIGAAHIAGGMAAVASGRMDERAEVVIADLSGLTEKMLLYAKERQWSKALETVTSLPKSIKADASAVTLVYNCALSAAVERPETVKQVYELMSTRGVNVNSTTVNTVLSSLSKSALWEEALPFFDKTPLANRDSNTYLIYFAMLGRQGLWKEAIEAYDGMRQVISKPPAAMFALIISTVSAHDWQTTLRVFQDMLKVHGASVKDSVVSQVIRCLEQHKRPVEVARLEKELAKRKKKKK
ncbi:hypothetical protein ABL78_2590 [Leptomonas seymouri]|uniref:Uncharacterized protein n=1 Tax=Leptomonas seymouri TaxID=5684 RepID=A0A0N1PF72_LEPSE|nr:hypothetical protein ABL78_2590 [Leptomonas seymouri]|eukprot:KPI88291.1 hypothetical protein ABL78_2590 [Leptomonas seymouri]